MNQASQNHERLVQAVSQQMAAFLTQEIGLEVQPAEARQGDGQRLTLGYLTSIVSVEDDISTLIACSFARDLIEQVFSVYAEGVEVAEDEREAMIEETAAEVVNVVVGNAMAKIQTPGKAMGLSPPVVLTEAKSLTRHRDTQFSSLQLQTSSGPLAMHFLCPKDALASGLSLGPANPASPTPTQSR